VLFLDEAPEFAHHQRMMPSDCGRSQLAQRRSTVAREFELDYDV